MKRKLLAVLILILLTIGLFTTFALSDDIPMMTKEELKALLGNPDCIILDVRHFSDYTSSDLKKMGFSTVSLGNRSETSQNHNLIYRGK